MPTTFTSIECPTCSARFEGVEVEAGYAALEARPCAHADCGAILCPACDAAKCDGCDALFCKKHLISIPDGTSRPLQCCAACAAETEVQHCPSCDSVNVYTEYISFGVEAATGYDDTVAVFSCRACGVRGEAEELVYRPVTELRHIARIQPARAELAVVARARA